MSDAPLGVKKYTLIGDDMPGTCFKDFQSVKVNVWAVQISIIVVVIIAVVIVFISCFEHTLQSLFLAVGHVNIMKENLSM